MTTTAIPGYTVIRLLGRGGMAAVYLARQESLGREVALKVLQSGAETDTAVAAERFLREARIAASLHHPHIVPIHDFGVHEGTAYLAMEYEPGGTIAPMPGEKLAPRDALRVVRDIAGALDYAHGRGVVHRDIKPDNILRRDDGAATLSDFGIARLLQGDSVLTTEGTSVGTPHYMSPEQLRGEKVDGRGDLYSLGIVLWQLLTGEQPFTGNDSWAIGMQHINAPVPRLPEGLAHLQPLLDALLAKQPGARLESGAELVRRIDGLLATAPTPLATPATVAIVGLPAADITVFGSPPPGPRWSRALARVAVAGLVALLLSAVVYFGFDKFVLAPKRDVALVTHTAQTVKAEALSSTKTTDNRASIAVLPFVNMSTDAENGFFADGISEELLNVLAGVKGLKVASRTSAFSFKGKDTPIPEIARQLGVQHVLEGSVRKQGRRVRITAQLIHAGSDGHLWSETYDRDLDDIFKVQEEIAQAITKELEGILGKRDVAVAASTNNLDAYQSFLRGRARFNQRDNLVAAIEDFSSAVKLDPEFAEAWVYLAATWQVAPGYNPESKVKAAEARAASRAALARARVLAVEHPMVLALQAQSLEDDGDFIRALSLLEEAGRTSVQDSLPIMWRGLLLLRAGYVEEAVATFEKAREMDPLAGINNGYLAIANLSLGRYAKAEETARRALSQGWDPALFIIVYDLAARGEHERAVAIWDELIAPGAPKEDAGQMAMQRALLLNPGNRQTVRVLNDDFIPEFSIAIDRPDLLFDRAEQERKKNPEDRRRQWWWRSAWLPSTLALREDPRFFALAEDIGMVRLWEARGYPQGCKRVSAASGDRLDCPGVSR